MKGEAREKVAAILDILGAQSLVSGFWACKLSGAMGMHRVVYILLSSPRSNSHAEGRGESGREVPLLHNMVGI